MKKTITVLLCILLMFSMTGYASYTDVENDSVYSYAIDNLSSLDIVHGNGDGTFLPYSLVSRAEFAKMAVLADDEKVGSNESCLFGDVQNGTWAVGYINTAAKNGIIYGYPDGTFCPKNNVTYAEAVTIALRLLGYTAEDIDGTYPYGYIDKAHELEIGNKIVHNPSDPVTRREAALIVSDTLFEDMAHSKSPLIEKMDYTVSEECRILNDFNTNDGEMTTSIGTYLIDGIIPSLKIGSKAKLVLDKNSNVKAVFCNESKSERFIAVSALGNELNVANSDGIKTFKLGDNSSIYFGGEKITMSELRKTNISGKPISIEYSSSGGFGCAVVGSECPDGPYVAGYDAYTGENGEYAGFKVIKEGKLADVSDIKKYDVLYPDPESAILTVYNSKITGSYEGMDLLGENGYLVNVGSASYNLSGKDAVLCFESSNFQPGDIITVLCGQNNDAVWAVSPSDIGREFYITGITGNEVQGIENGEKKVIDIPDERKIYINGTQTTYGDAVSSLDDGYKLVIIEKATGAIDCIVAQKQEYKGPYLVSGSLSHYFEYNPSDVSVIRDGKASSLENITDNDIVYYYSGAKTIYAYCDKVSGVYEKAYPSSARPSSVTISGKAYDVETQECSSKLGNGYSVNDYITVYLGKDGKIADVRSASQDGESSYGVLLSCSKKTVDGKQDYYCTFLSATGASQEFKAGKDYSSYKGSVCSYSFGSDGYLKFKTVSSSSVSLGKPNASAQTIGGYNFASGAKIIDISYIPSGGENADAAAGVVELSDIEKSAITASDIKFVRINSSNKISALFLNNVTKCGYKFGIVTAATKNSTTTDISLDIDGKESSYTFAGIKTIKPGQAVMAIVQNGQLLRIDALTKISSSGKISELSNEEITVGNVTYKPAKGLICYKKNPSYTYVYNTISADEVEISDIRSAELYADALTENGGLVRIVKLDIK